MNEPVVDLPVNGLARADAAYEQIKSAIVGGALPPGSRISEQTLARRLNVSRTPVHQAVVRLQNDEWLEVESRSGLVIAPLRAEQMREIYEVLVGLEGIAVRALASRPAGAEADEVEAELAAASARCDAALDANDLRGWAEADNAFHRLLLARSGNPLLLRVASPLSDHAHRARVLTVGLRPWPKASNDDHDQILSAIRARNPDAAHKALVDHRERGVRTLVPILEALSPEPAFDFRPLGARP